MQDHLQKIIQKGYYFDEDQPNKNFFKICNRKGERFEAQIIGNISENPLQILNFLQIYNSLQHQNISQIVDIFLDQQYLIAIMMIEENTLNQITELDQDQVQIIFYELLKIIFYIRQKGLSIEMDSSMVYINQMCDIKINLNQHYLNNYIELGDKQSNNDIQAVYELIQNLLDPNDYYQNQSILKMIQNNQSLENIISHQYFNDIYDSIDFIPSQNIVEIFEYNLLTKMEIISLIIIQSNCILIRNHKPFIDQEIMQYILTLQQQDEQYQNILKNNVKLQDDLSYNILKNDAFKFIKVQA